MRLRDEFGLQFDGSTKAQNVSPPADGFGFGHARQVLSFVAPRLIEVRHQSQRVIHRLGGLLDRGCHR
jgi:hypothetical protein